MFVEHLLNSIVSECANAVAPTVFPCSSLAAFFSKLCFLFLILCAVSFSASGHRDAEFLFVQVGDSYSGEGVLIKILRVQDT
jgi:hypothetical protein